jgi:hypothetical protein
MKKTILILIACLLIPLPVYAFSGAIQAVLGASGAPALSCTTADDSAIWNHASGVSNLAFGYTTKFAGKLTLAATTRITALGVHLRDLATTNACTVTISLYTDSSDLPGSLVTGVTASIAESDISDAANTWYELALATPTSVAAGTYWVVYENNHGSETGTTRMVYNASGGAGIATNTTGTWSVVNAAFDANVVIYGCQ